MTIQALIYWLIGQLCTIVSYTIVPYMIVEILGYLFGFSDLISTIRTTILTTVGKL